MSGKWGRIQRGCKRAISYQITPCGVFYRRDIAQNVFGTDDPVDRKIKR
nr:hypothetical protein [uncultured Blautia sp.]